MGGDPRFNIEDNKAIGFKNSLERTLSHPRPSSPPPRNMEQWRKRGPFVRDICTGHVEWNARFLKFDSDPRVAGAQSGAEACSFQKKR